MIVFLHHLFEKSRSHRSTCFDNTKDWKSKYNCSYLTIYNNLTLAIGLVFVEQYESWFTYLSLKSLQQPWFTYLSLKSLQQVMRFAELTQEVQVARQEQVRFDTGLTPGRRRLHKQYKEAVAKMQEEGLDAENAPVPFIYSMGPPFPKLEVGFFSYHFLWLLRLFLLIYY